ncbi:NADP-dependent oxidoreductase domain-containing protein [Collybia nuda]|uniref:NADP-dependent oxidoreductase domain-containing protein n=1 Tax=Collybia nuda TaxID=64659 RepID=A0A9P5YBJ5_9AGAR|nr:NADP-dependent oxidoreductase domain-containing protein [Collybia nuda]
MPFSIYQGMWNVMDCNFEWEIIPMARNEGPALAPWNVLTAGKFCRGAEGEAHSRNGEYHKMFSQFERTEKGKRVSEALKKIATEVGIKHTTAVAIAYCLHKVLHVFLLIDGCKFEHVHASLEALGILLSDARMKELEAAPEFDLGFPSSFIVSHIFFVKLCTNLI